MTALLLDLGGTVFRSGIELMGLLAEHRPELRAVLARRGPLGSEPDELWDRMIDGEVTERAYWHARSEEVGAALGRQWPIQEFMHLLYAQTDDVVRPEAERLVADAKAAGLPVGVLTNDLRAFHGDGAMAAHPLLRAVDVIVDGSDTGVLKPDPEAFALGVDALSVAAGDIVFVDDMPWNIAAARKVGMIALALDLRDPAEVFSRARIPLGLPQEAA